MRRNTAVQKLARMGVMSALALVLVGIESVLPPLLVFAPGAKIGIGNIVVLLSLITLGYWEGGVIMLVKCLFGAVYGNFAGLIYSLPAGIVSFAVMAIMVKFTSRFVSVVAISVVGAVLHNTVQVAVACAIINTINYMGLLPMLLAASVLAGLVVGFTVYFIIRFVPAKILIGGSSGHSIDNRT